MAWVDIRMRSTSISPFVALAKQRARHRAMSSTYALRLVIPHFMKHGVLPNKGKEKVTSIKSKLESGKTDDVEKECQQLVATATEKGCANCDVIVQDVINIGISLVEKKQLSMSLSLMKWAINLCENISDAELKLKMLVGCGEVAAKVAEELFMNNLKDQIKDQVFPIQLDLYDRIKAVKSSDLKLKAAMECEGACYLGACHCYVENYTPEARFLESAICGMDDEFGDDAVKYKVYGGSVGVLACINQGKGKHKEAVELARKSLEAMKKAEDYENEK
ncbi:unnamed protein product [Clavelina lepadiformis]|uniref:Uncharacterized protein n=1 Tax=Clavelina lepadiformis TaxID=159417 RepID=A0ABP0GBA8_CLALP